MILNREKLQIFTFEKVEVLEHLAFLLDKCFRQLINQLVHVNQSLQSHTSALWCVLQQNYMYTLPTQAVVIPMWQKLVPWFRQRWQSGSPLKTTTLSWWSSGHKYQRERKKSVKTILTAVFPYCLITTICQWRRKWRWKENITGAMFAAQ